MDRIHLVTDDDLYNRKAFYKVKVSFIHSLLLMVEKDIRSGICHAIQKYTKANHKYMKKLRK